MSDSIPPWLQDMIKARQDQVVERAKELYAQDKAAQEADPVSPAKRVMRLFTGRR